MQNLRRSNLSFDSEIKELRYAQNAAGWRNKARNGELTRGDRGRNVRDLFFFGESRCDRRCLLFCGCEGYTCQRKDRQRDNEEEDDRIRHLTGDDVDLENLTKPELFHLEEKTIKELQKQTSNTGDDRDLFFFGRRCQKDPVVDDDCDTPEPRQEGVSSPSPQPPNPIILAKDDSECYTSPNAKLQVVVLTGQSNMIGHACENHLKYLGFWSERLEHPPGCQHSVLFQRRLAKGYDSVTSCRIWQCR